MAEVLRDGRYEIVGKLGEGAQGTTFDAIDTLAGRAVAIKRFAVRGAKSWKDVELAEREASVLESLSHPALPAHVEHFEEDGALYLVMEKVDGTNLAQLIARGRSLSRDEVIGFLRDASDVLGYLHGRAPPVIHRDINPKNVIRRPDGKHVLVDFGAVRDRLSPEGGSTVVGTFGYMAPEQFQGRAVPASDVYAVGATLLRLLTGIEPEKQPHRGLAIDVGAALGSRADPGLREALEKMLEPDPDRRASSLGPLLQRLEGHTRDRPAARARRANADGWDRKSKYAKRDEHRRIREERHARRRARKEWRRGRPIHGPPLWALLLALEVTRLVVGFVVGFVVPMILMVLSVVFGSGLRRAARQTREASQEARASMDRARQHLLGRTTLEDASQVRVPEPPAPKPRVRVALEPDDVIDTTGIEADSDAKMRR